MYDAIIVYFRRIRGKDMRIIYVISWTVCQLIKLSCYVVFNTVKAVLSILSTAFEMASSSSELVIK